MSKRMFQQEPDDYRPKSRDRKTRRTKTTPTLASSGSWIKTYRPSRHEAGWLGDSLSLFHEMGLIDDILFQVQGGKEATVYCCATPEGGLLAAKVYRPRKFRQLRNDKLYRMGREVLTSSGTQVRETEHRIMRAIVKRTAYGEKVRHSSWLMYEYTTLERLFEAGAAVPRPHASASNAILMDYIGDARLAAPTLTRQTLPLPEATQVLGAILENIDLMLSMGIVHGDLSPYNILYDRSQITLIDFPQVTEVGVNPHIKEIFWRDIARVCDHFAAMGVDVDAGRVAETIWGRHVITVLEDIPEPDREER